VRFKPGDRRGGKDIGVDMLQKYCILQQPKLTQKQYILYANAFMFMKPSPERERELEKYDNLCPSLRMLPINYPR
jgi:hypothetical protein